MFKKILQLFCVSVDTVVRKLGKGVSIMVPILAFVVIYGTVARYLFDAPPIWTFDTALFLFGYVAALGGAYAQQKRAHINVDIFYIRVSPKVKATFNLITYALGIFFLIVVSYLCYTKFTEAYELGFRRQTEWAPLMSHFWLMFTISSAIFTVQLIRDFLADLYYLITGTPLLEEKEQINGN
ncbi:TRAP transporter, small permease subunit [Halarcobacter ebronensis]|uniref:C4-dicarboxylate ABC transporter permease n=2 Tax=Halarcobacter ebronensis TaxID=1462615 RepID=A0A4Q1AEF0_9BACT|nr:TRAP transporter, small permease subunit [Halarcobacter ebronensis]RXK00859.1 C4-dicarboxylate ABC transporter permease [Halarcobacter ebronensis]